MSGTPPAGPVPAGSFTTWLGMIAPALHGRAEADVPCGDCTGCCRSSQFILVEESDADAHRAIPADLLFPAPFLPGALLLGYDEQGRCPMLGDAGCTIYDARPMTCRTYDCRVFAAAGVESDKPAVAERASRWEFDHPGPADVAAHDAVMAAARWIGEHSADLPEHLVPPHRTALAVVAVELHPVFLRDGELVQPSDAAVRAALESVVAARR
jgi:Fe-S-cluster containining protein